jgi:hypothetical protein
VPLYQADDIADLVKGTLVDLGRLRWTNIATSFQKYVFGSNMLRKEKVGFDSGRDVQWNLQVAQSQAARMVALGQPDVVNIVDTMQTAVVPWRHCTTSWAVIRQTLKMNREPAKIYDLLKEYRTASMISLAELLETQGWSMPSSPSDTLNLFGVPYWLVPNTTQGFNGGNPVGTGGAFSAGCGGLSSASFPNWSNYTDSYGAVTKADFVRRLRRLYVFCDFETPVGVDVPTYNTGNKHGFYGTYFVVGLLEEICEQQNDNLGHDVAKMDGKCVFRGVPVTWVPRLETLSASTNFSNSTYASSGGYPMNPLYAINWGVFRPIFFKGEYLLEHGPIPVPFQHTALQTFVDLTVQVECRDRRLNGVLTQ